MKKIEFVPIGVVSSLVTEQTDESWGKVISRIILQPEYIGALSGLEDFSHAIIVTYLHQANYKKEKHLQRRPQGIESMPKVGIFSQRAKNRPNSIGITAVTIKSVGDDYLEVQGFRCDKRHSCS